MKDNVDEIATFVGKLAHFIKYIRLVGQKVYCIYIIASETLDLFTHSAKITLVKLVKCLVTLEQI